MAFTHVEEIHALCQKYDVPLIEDAAESLGSFYLSSDGDGNTWKHTGTKGIMAALVQQWQ